MSKMNELATALDEMAGVGRTLITCGEELMKAAARVKASLSETEEEPVQLEETTEVSESEPAPTRMYTKEEVRAILADLSQNGFRKEAKELVRKYSDGGSLTDIDPAKYPDLVAEAEALHG